MKKIVLDLMSIKILAKKFNVDRGFVEESLNLTELPKLKAVSGATNIKEAEAEQVYAENCCNEDERAAFRKWLEFASGDEEEILRAYERIGDCEEAKGEKMLAIRTMAETLFPVQ